MTQEQYAAYLREEGEKRARKQARSAAKPEASVNASDIRDASKLEQKFLMLWHACRGPVLLSEHVWHPTRKWRFDFAHMPSMTAIEIEGGVWVGGRHTSPVGFLNDAEKYFEATLAGWRVLRLTEQQINAPTLASIIDLLAEKSC